MRERGGVILALLAGLGAVSYQSSVSTNTAPATGELKAGQAPFQQIQSAESELAETLGRFDKLRTFEIGVKKNGSCAVTPQTIAVAKGEAAKSFDWAMAIVPDPERSNLRLDFDRDIEAIQLAASRTGYQFERYWFPWRTEAHSAKEDPYLVHDLSGKGNGTLIAPVEDNRGSLPGVMLFRNKKDQPPLALFLVSESPVAGIAPEEFRTAVCLGRSLAELGGGHDDGKLRLIGPGISGSLEPLSLLIRSQEPPFSQATIRTWTMDHGLHNRFRESLQPLFLKEDDSLDFKPLLVDSYPAIARFLEYKRKIWHDDTPIVLLTEESTAFGTETLDGPYEEPGADREIKELMRRLSSKGHDREAIFRVPFPRNLSQLRNATEKQDHLPGFGDDSKRLDVPRTGLLLSLKQEGNAGLEIPTFSGEQTPISQESVLFTIGNVLKTGVIHYVGILATDALDTMFLTRYLRSASPNLRIFTLNTDLLFEHGSDSSDYSGILGLSTYPLFPLSQVWTGARDGVYVFPSDAAEAVYNATSAVLHDVPSRPTHDKGSDEVDHRDGFDPFKVSGDALWITVAGRSGFEPIAIAHSTVPEKEGKPPDRKDQLPGKPTQRFPPEYWPGWSYSFSLILSLCGGFCILELFARPQGRPVFAVFAAYPDGTQSNQNNNQNTLARGFYLSSIGCGLTALVAIWLVVPGVVVEWNIPKELRPQLESTGFLLFVAGALLVGLLSSMLMPAARSQPPPEARPSETPSRSAAAAAVAGSFLFFLPPVLSKLPADTGSTYVIPHLWLFFRIGCFFLGATLAASILPFWSAVRVECKRPGPGNLLRCATSPYSWCAVAITLLTAFVILFAAYTIRKNQYTDFLASYRSLDLTNGVSPIVPVTLLLAALIVVAFVHLRRIEYYEERRPDLPEMKNDLFCPKVDGIIDVVNIRIHGFRSHPLFWLALACLAGLACSSFSGSAQTLEEQPLEVLIICAALAVGFFVTLVWIRLVLLWSAFSELLQQLERHPIRRVFSLLPRGFVWSPVWQGGGKKRTHVAITRSLECIGALRNQLRTPDAMKAFLQEEWEREGSGALTTDVKDLLASSADRRKFSTVRYRVLEKTMARIAQVAVEYLQENKWLRGDYELKSELATKEETKDALHLPWPRYEMEEPATICGEFVAFRFLAFINFVLWQIDNLVACVSVGFLLLVLALNSYAFRSRTIIDWILVLFFGVLTVGIVTMFAQADRDAILSRITGTEEGKLDRNFFTHLLSYGGIPALVLLSTHFPVIGRFFFSWVKPALEAIH